MLYRFREAQAAELGLGTRADRRPRMASACKSLRECERWRGEILREISRKVSKIQDAGLTDYEVRDLNDEINKLLREKRHWENQIIALGGANYRRNVAMLDEDGKEVPGTKGYKYFGRAKDLPGVRELFESRKNEQEEEDRLFTHYKRFMSQGPAYYGDLDEANPKLLEYERLAEEEDWEEACLNVYGLLGLPTTDIPKLPISAAKPPSTSDSSLKPSSKRKADDHDSDDVDMDDNAKRSKPTNSVPLNPSISAPEADSTRAHAQAAASYIPFLKAENLVPPKLLTREEMEAVLLDLRKKALVDEYFGDEAS
ncbi:pre-mRNA-splicing factor ISY1 [Coprinopsis marcescibilis]|uniref:Pre-mRNA-splicing factor ISY1 n=1 Tax=Coprinopsis marcescibilis TaxID=230819 RepID=A0A5C3L663_COPMA|nr:pre-mRNA-splicing factor ISY1 [Coprinopsis marcescibilis]